ncbi:MAG: hypothetical protein CMP23_11455 [Rickettsiales bacterium]|nr:hypothetical protein [Rickettsiales bacterium]|tara:strand:+ start:3574 stop:4485 length:912 start_codon:yes stop_codon:yes gene_type:complete
MLILALVCALPQQGLAAACCGVGNTPGRTGQVATTENLAIGAGWWLRALTGRWNDGGELSGVRGEESLLQTFSPWLTLRPQAQLQAGVVLPILLQKLSFGSTDHYGAGLGDLNLWMQWEPLAPSPRRRFPVPIVGLGLTLPTGVPIERAPNNNPARATGTGRLTLLPSLRLEQTFRSMSLSVGGQAGLSLPRPDRPDLGVPGIALNAELSAAWFLNPQTTLALSGGMEWLTAGMKDGITTGRSGYQPWMGLAVVLSPKPSSRFTFAVRHSLAIPKLGRNAESRLLLSITGSWIGRKLWPLESR